MLAAAGTAGLSPGSPLECSSLNLGGALGWAWAAGGQEEAAVPEWAGVRGDGEKPPAPLLPPSGVMVSSACEREPSEVLGLG